MKEKLKIAFVGYGQRGTSILNRVLAMSDVEVIGVCDAYLDRTAEMVEKVKNERGDVPFAGKNHRELIANCTLDAAIVCTSWSAHIPITIDFMEAGIPVGFEVGGCDSVEECWELVRAYRRTGVECMMLENCCYARDEMMVLNMVKKGIFGEIVHCEGGYMHDLRSEIITGKEKRHYRLAQYKNRNCDNYPTHALGPIAKILNINRGNRMLSLTSTASKSAGIKDYLKTHEVENKELYDEEFVQGDVITTVIKCAHGETITLTLDTSLPRFYSRNFNVSGTRALYHCDSQSIFLPEEYEDGEFSAQKIWGNVEKYREKYEHPLWKEYIDVGIAEGHGGMDWLVLRAFVESVKKGAKPPIDVYDAVAWMAITPLSESSIAMGGAPVEFPDFTYGQWVEEREEETGKYALDAICIDPDTPIYI